MPFSFTNKSAGDLIRSQDWNAAMAAIVALYDKLNGTTGHRHTGGPEDGPLITSAALQDLAVLTQKLADLAVTTQKLADLSVTNQKLANTSVDGSKIANNSVAAAHIIAGAVDNTKLAANAVANAQIQNGAVTNAKMAANSIGSSQLMDLTVSVNKIVDGSVTTPKIADGQVTAAKLAAGVAPQIGIAVSYCYNGQTAAIPSGFLLSEVRFFCGMDFIRVTIPGGAPGGTIHLSPQVDSNGTLTVYDFTTYTSRDCRASVVALGKKGGW